MKPIIIFSKSISIRLINMGFTVVNIQPHRYNPKLDPVVLFDYSDELVKVLKEVYNITL